MSARAGLLLLFLSACVSAPPPAAVTPFSAPTKSLTAPPLPAKADGAFVPPEGRGVAGLDFGAWRSTDPESLSRAYAAQVAAAIDALPLDAARAWLERTGHRCRDGDRPDARPVPLLECRIGVLDGSCGHDWVTEVWPGQPQPNARYSRFCQPSR